MNFITLSSALQMRPNKRYLGVMLTLSVFLRAGLTSYQGSETGLKRL
jgi:hypothetical protein